MSYFNLLPLTANRKENTKEKVSQIERGRGLIHRSARTSRSLILSS